MKNTSTLNRQDEESDVNLQQVFEQYLYYWKWFIFSVIACVVLVFIYLRYTSPIYNSTAKILLQDEKQAGGEMAGLAELSQL